MKKLKIAIQKSGRMSEQSRSIFEQCGIKVNHNERKLMAEASNFPIEFLFLRDDDIPQYVEQKVADIGIIGLNEVLEKGKNVKVIEELGFASCKLSLAIPKTETYTNKHYFEGKKIATSYPNILKKYLAENQIQAEIEEIMGSVEIAPSIGLANAIFDIVSTGSTLVMNGLKEVEVVLKSQAVMIGYPDLNVELQQILDRLLFRMRAVKQSQEHKYILLNAPNESLPAIEKNSPRNA